MNITADPGLLYNMSELFTVNITKKRIYFSADSLPLVHLTETSIYYKKLMSILNITKQNPFYLVHKPLYFEP